MIVYREGMSLVMFICETASEKQWLVDNVEAEDYQWMGEDSLAVETRFAGELIRGLVGAGILDDEDGAFAKAYAL